MKPNFFVHESAIVDDGATIGEGTKIWHFSHIMPNAVIGRNCNLGQNVFVADDVELKDGVKIQNNVSLYTGVICEENVFLGPSVVLTNVKNPRSAVNRRGEYQTTLLKEGATIGANATVVCGVTLGRYCFVAAGSVVTKNVPDFALMQGSPARQNGWMSKYGQRLYFDENQEAVCSGDGTTYVLENGSVREKY